MKVNCRVSLNPHQLETLKEISEFRNMSQMIRSVVAPYLKGQKVLPKGEKAVSPVSSTVSMEYEDMMMLRALVEAADQPFDQAMRLMVTEYLRENQNSRTNPKLDNI